MGNYNSPNSTSYKNKSLTSVAISSETYFGIKQVSRSGSKHYTVSNVQDTKTGVDLCLLFRLSYKGIFLLVDNSFCFQIDAHFFIRKMCHSNFCENRGQYDQFARKKKQINKLMCLCNVLM